MKPEFKIPMSKPDMGKEEERALLKVLKSDWPSQGTVTEEFESLLSKYMSSNVIVVNNGSSALMSVLMAHGIKPGDKIIVPAFTFVATSSIPKILGAEIILADIDPKTLNISPESVEQIVKKTRVKMVIVVDIGGSPVDIDRLTELSKRYNFILVEDGAQSFGAEYKKKKLGSFEHTAIFSFQIAKQLTTIEGGCIASLDDNIMKKISQIKDYGRNKNERYIHDVVGANFRTTDLQSSIGIIQLKKVNDHILRRNEIARKYRKQITGVKFQTVPKFVTKHSYMIFFVLTKNKTMRDKYIQILNTKGVDARKSWPPLHMQPCNYDLCLKKYPNAEKVFNHAFTLPIYNSMTFEEAKMVIDICENM